ncbi:uncharacterized protein LOC135163467 [Diachasmimorpha longicaudata]|uniref:uncharacterized protein LOC135163467 n=1 Tax=Diachasmimorpha longicaudata TaxID=58733 RepID=UPI0030B91458
MISARLRLLGRFLIQMKIQNEYIKEFSHIFNPHNYDCAIIAVRQVARYVPEEHIFKTPAVASNLGTLMKHVGEIFRSECIKNESPDDQRRVEDFLTLLGEDFGTSINRVVAETQTQNNRRKEIILPSTEDIKKLYEFIKAERSQYFMDLSKEFSHETWKKLGKTTLLSLQIFNRRRPGEIERIYIQDFRSYRGLDHIADKETFNSLTEEGKKIAKKYVRFEIREKLGRGVPVLVEKDVLQCSNLLIKYRDVVGVPKKNMYLFGLPSNDNDCFRYHWACQLIRSYAVKCGAQIPHVLRGTQLRKHIATRCINLNLSENQVTDLANFMGHHEKIHREIYHQPVLKTDIIKISKILNTAQGFDESDVSADENDVSGTSSRMMSSRADRYGDSSTSRVSDGNRSYNSSVGQFAINNAIPKRWSIAQRNTVLSAFDKYLAESKMPTGAAMQTLIDSNACLKERTVPQMRSWLHAEKKKISQV